MSIIDEDNYDLVSVCVDRSNEGQVQHKEVISLLPQKNYTVDLTTTLNSNNYSVHKYDDKKYDLPAWNQSSTDDEENDETEDPFDTAKPYPSLEAKIEIYLSSTIDTVPILAT